MKPLAERVRYEIGLVQSTPINQIAREVSTLARLLVEQQAEIERLGNELKSAQMANISLATSRASFALVIDSLRRDLEACKVDAERMQFCEDHVRTIYTVGDEVFVVAEDGTYSGQMFRDAIDAARARGEG